MKVRVSAHQIDGEFSLRQKRGPVVDGERRVCSSQDTEKLTSEGLDGPFSGVGAFLYGRYELVQDILGVKVGW